MHKSTAFHSIVIVSIVFLSVFNSVAQEPGVDEIVAKHLGSIGSTEARSAVRNRLAIGLSTFESKLPAKKAMGKAVVASDEKNLMFLTSFSSQEYPFEKIGYFNEKVNLPWVTSGNRSPLGAFIADHEKLLNDGLFTGTMSSRWSLLNKEKHKPRLDYVGSKKVDGRQMHILDYVPRGVGSSQFSVRLFFDTETFRHVRSEFRDQISPQERIGILGRQSGVRIQLIEIYDDFKTVDGITLPYSYRAEYLTDSNSGVHEFIWGIKVHEYRFNQNLGASFFTFEDRK